MSAPDRRAKLDRDHPRLSVRRQCAMVGISRSGVYRPPRPANDDDLTVLRRIDELFTLAAPGLTTDDGDAAGRGTGDQPQACAAVDASNGDRRFGAEAADHEAGGGTHDLSVSSAA